MALCSDERTAITQVLTEHTLWPGVMASPGHWSYEASKRGEGDWFVHCGQGWQDCPGCGWSSEPLNFVTKEEARQAGIQHLVDVIDQEV